MTSTATNATFAVPDTNVERARILCSLDKWIRQRPGLEFGNYGDVSAYRSEMRSITRDLHHARTLLRAVTWRSGIGAPELIRAFDAYSGRLTWDSAKCRLDYCTGQYWPTEYRRAACAVLASALWDYTREHAMPAPDIKKDGEDRTYGGKSAGDWLRSYFRKEFGKRIANRWFN